ncbi:PREDICTED: uncharacterized protein LOC108559833 [Nicrophorus vespilloides]|uniref:Uncharacterized protein LOC108559833 n=1 Tax=Nicrophorus vespilloides TaxID=110193 RepID=A0ABM1MDN0_NICVS|nr:PREDICTED: uncharacterized protein LOC108559833 [Nicrophorus vespilloides]
MCNCDNCFVYILLHFEFDDDPKKLIDLMAKKVRKLKGGIFDKVFYQRDSCLGYNYYFRGMSDLDELLEFIGDVNGPILNDEGLSEKIKLCDTMKMPNGGRGLMKVLICLEQTLKKNHYVIIFKFHHCLSDGKYLLDLISSGFGDGELEIDIQKPPPRYNIWKKYIVDGYLTQGLKIDKDDNILRGYNLEEVKHFVFIYDDDNNNYINKIKHIKNKLNAAYLDVFNSCLATSLYEYYKKMGANIPKWIVTGTVQSPSYIEDSTNVLQNRFTAIHIKLPIQADSVMERLDIIKNNYEIIKKSLEIEFTYWLGQHVLIVLPNPIIYWTFSLMNITAGISVMNMSRNIILFGKPIKTFIGFPPNSPGTGIHTVLTKYDEKLLLILTVDRSVIEKYEDVKKLGNRIVFHIDELYKMIS